MSIEDKITKMAEFFGYRVEDIVGRNANRKVSMARNYIFYVLHTNCGMSANAIARKFNRQCRHIFRQNAVTKYQVENFNDSKEIYAKLQLLISE
jgi:chromosomal replication initiation ATPase DnaA